MLIPYVLPPHESGRLALQPANNSASAPEKRPESVLDERKSGYRPSESDAKPASGEKAFGDPSVTAAHERPLTPNLDVDSKAARDDVDGEEKPQVPAGLPEPRTGSAPAEPVLVPAVNLKFPKQFTDEEMSKALEPLLSFRVSDEDTAAIKEVISAASRGDSESAKIALRKISDPAAKTFADWRRLRSSNDVGEIMTFRNAHPAFPEPTQDPGLEKNLFLSNASSAEVLKFYAHRSPQTGAGKASLGGALIETGERQRGVDLIKLAWNRYTLDAVVQEHFVARFGALLDSADQVRRKLMLSLRARQPEGSGKSSASLSHRGSLKRSAGLRGKLGKGRTMNGGRHGKRVRGLAHGKGRRRGEVQSPELTKQALLGGRADAFPLTTLSELVKLKKATPENEASGNPTEEVTRDSPPAKPGVPDKPESPEKGTEPKAKSEAKEDNKPAAKSLQAKAAEKAFKLTKERMGSPATLLAKLKALRREGADEDLWSLLRSISPDSADLADPDRWWELRRNELRRALNDEHPRTAYAIAKAHGPLDDENRSEAEFMAGWIALRFLKNPHLAQAHFETARAINGSVRDDARANYWLGRVKLELGSPKEAEAYFNEAANRFYTFYGALAVQALQKRAACAFRAPSPPSPEAVTAFVNEEAFKAVMIAKQLDFQPLLVSFFLELARGIQDAQQMTLMLELAERTVPAHVAIRAAKIALLRGFAAEAYAFPTLLPKFDPAGGNGNVEPALLNALTRQESEFHTSSVSRAGARGLMQLMPQTAKLVATANKMKYELPRLISDPSYNVTIGSAFLAQLISGYKGSYILALAAYNAGPGRVTQWIGDFGDPRNKAIDPIDWVERIPFAETRHYVQRILESTQLYRCRFENTKARFQIVEDLHRGRPGKIPDFADVTGSGELDQTP